jgi:hypothetical protein
MSEIDYERVLELVNELQSELGASNFRVAHKWTPEGNDYVWVDMPYGRAGGDADEEKFEIYRNNYKEDGMDVKEGWIPPNAFE